MAFSMHASALGTQSWILNYSPLASQGSGPFGTVTVTETSATTVTVDLALAAGVNFVTTGGPHHALAYSLSTGPAVVSGLTAGFVAGPAPATNTPFGDFTNSIDCGLCGNGASPPIVHGPLDFTLTDAGGISIASFIGSTGGVAPGGWLFSADVIAQGFTGNVAVNAPAIPEPETYAMMLAGLGLLGFVARRRRQGLGGNFVPA
jgi:hypothetical protein